ncbi:MAG: hypothetical protein KatS3mg029_0202 [Saprospiraceae bacterium]|nr:MAG: hypothetical protein KatS3mg029_0202 [Saprospiraceae bacterium]
MKKLVYLLLLGIFGLSHSAWAQLQKHQVLFQEIFQNPGFNKFSECTFRLSTDVGASTSTDALRLIVLFKRLVPPQATAHPSVDEVPEVDWYKDEIYLVHEMRVELSRKELIEWLDCTAELLRERLANPCKWNKSDFIELSCNTGALYVLSTCKGYTRMETFRIGTGAHFSIELEQKDLQKLILDIRNAAGL